MILESFTMLGKTVPEPTRSDGRIFVCSAGVAPEVGLVRIYPLAWRAAPRRWHTYRVPVERNPKDSRKESFKVAGDRSEDAHPVINRLFVETGEVKARHRPGLLADYVVGSIQEANARRLSLAILRPRFGDVEFEHSPGSPAIPDVRLFDGVAGAKRFPCFPRLRFTDDGGDHRLMIRDWGAFEWMRKYPDRCDELAACLHLTEKSSLLVGNMNHRRTSWLIISVLNGLQE